MLTPFIEYATGQGLMFHQNKTVYLSCHLEDSKYIKSDSNDCVDLHMTSLLVPAKCDGEVVVSSVLMFSEKSV